MNTENGLQKKLEAVTAKWWFVLLLVVLFLMPAYTTKTIDPKETADAVISILSNALIYSNHQIFPIFKIAPLAMIALLILYKKKATVWFNIYVGLNILLVAIFQNMADTETYGFSVLIGNMITNAIVALAWLYEAAVRNGEYRKVHIHPINVFFIVLALFTYWYPMNIDTLKPDFNPLYLLTSKSGLTFSALVPIYLTILLLFYPDINRVTLRVTGLVGAVTGIMNIVQFFFRNPDLRWMGILHLPLLLISFYAVFVSWHTDQKSEFKVDGRDTSFSS